VVNQSGIYIITNNLNKHCYIGSALNIRKRWNRHKSDLCLQKHHSLYLQRAYNKYGSVNFTFTILLICDKKDLLFYEQRAIDRYKPEYNQCPVAGNCTGHKTSEEAKRKLSECFSGSKNPNFGKKHSDETKLKISLGNKGKILSQETKDKISAKNKGRKSSLIGIPLSPEHREKMSKTKIENKSAKGENNAMYGLKEINHPKFGKKNPYSTSKYYGVSKRTRGNLTYWRATVDVNGKRIEIGQRKSEVEAATIYNQYVVVHKLKNPLNDL